MIYYALSDLHGHLDALRTAITHVPLDSDPSTQLILLGDYIDRGPHSFQTLSFVREIQRAYSEQVTVLAGNHDIWLADDWIGGDHNDLAWLYAPGSFETLRSFLSDEEMATALGHGDPERWDHSDLPGAVVNRNLKDAMKARHGDLLRWVRALPRVHETEHHIWVHAGVDESAGPEFWLHGTPPYMLVEKYPASIGPHDLGKVIVAGHVRASELHGDPNRHGVYADGGYHLYIDGSVEVTGQLNLLRIDGETSEWSEMSVGAEESGEWQTRG